ncbi:hypothetical protein WJX79_010359 [Trebouxia sp. C0005]
MQTPARCCQVALFVPNLIGYLRLVLLAAAVCTGVSAPQLTYCLFLVNLLLDGLDGIAARRLNQCSSFGAFLDVFVDNLTRGTLWVWSTPAPFGILPVILETTVFTCTHRGGGAAWKTGCFSQAPRWVQSIMADGFKTPSGALAVVGLMGLPLWLWACRYMPGSLYASPFFGVLVIVGRLVCASVEVWVLCAHISGLLQQDKLDCDKSVGTQTTKQT